MTRHAWVIIAACAPSIGCSNDDNGTQPGDQGVGGFVPATGGSIGEGGVAAGGFGGTAGAGTGGMATAMPVPCGSNTCQPTQSPLAGFIPAPTPCCVDATAGTCGTLGTTGTCAPPAMSDPRCPSQFGSLATTCCINNDCGIDASMFGMGCIDYTTFGMFVMPQHCDGTPFQMNTGGAGGSAGTGGTGGERDSGTHGSGGTSTDSGASRDSGTHD